MISSDSLKEKEKYAEANLLHPPTHPRKIEEKYVSPDQNPLQLVKELPLISEGLNWALSEGYVFRPELWPEAQAESGIQGHLTV